MEEALRRAVEAAAARPEAAAAVASVYADLALEVSRRQPLCSASGACCRFEEYGHRLYVSTLELAAFVAGWSNPVPTPASPRGRSLPVLGTSAAAPWDGTGCPFQAEGLCGARAARPFGCRIYFCDPTSTDWQHDLYEKLHAELRHRHEALGVEYFYVEWRYALRTLGLVSEGASRPRPVP